MNSLAGCSVGKIELAVISISKWFSDFIFKSTEIQTSREETILKRAHTIRKVFSMYIPLLW
jgi:hypothetical protein